MSYHMSGFGGMEGLGIFVSNYKPESITGQPIWLNDSYYFDKDRRGAGSRCTSWSGTFTYGCPCPDGWRLQKNAKMVTWTEQERQPEGGTKAVKHSAPAGYIAVMNQTTKKTELLPRFFSCVPSSTCELNQTRVKARLIPFDVEIHPLPGDTFHPKTSQGFPIDYVKVIRRAPVEGNFCFDKDPRIPADPKRPAGFADPKYTCADMLKALTACKGVTTGGCKAFNDIEGLIRLNCAEQGGYEEPDKEPVVRHAPLPEYETEEPKSHALLFVAVAAAGVAALVLLAKRARR